MPDAQPATASKNSSAQFSTDPWWALLVEVPRGICSGQGRRLRSPRRYATSLYDLSQGITDLLIKLLVLSQRRALRLKRERVTIADLPPSLHKRTGTPKPPEFAALRKGTLKCADAIYEDLHFLQAEGSAEHIAAMEHGCWRASKGSNGGCFEKSGQRRIRFQHIL